MPNNRVFGDPQVDALRARQAIAISQPGPTGPPGPPGLSGPIAGISSIADLRTFPVTGVLTDTTVILLGYYADNDGGGGSFYWTHDTTTPDDGGSIIVPTAGPRTGAWMRVLSQPLNPKWWGAKGDGSSTLSPDGIHTVDQVAIQSAIDYTSPGLPINGAIGNDVLIPEGQYVINAPVNDAAIWIDRSHNVKLMGVGSAPYGSQLKIVGIGTAIAIESNAPNFSARGVQIRNLTIFGAGTAPRDGIVGHAPNIAIYDCWILQFARFGILIESGTVSDVLGVTRAPVGTTFSADFWGITGSFFQTCGDLASGGDPDQGAGVYAHGGDSNGGSAISCFADNCNVGFHDGTLGSALWSGCYSEAGNLSFSSRSLNTSVYVHCFSEDLRVFQAIDSGSGMAVGGSVAVLGELGGPSQRIANHKSALTFGETGLDNLVYGANIPGQHNSSIDITRNYPPRNPAENYPLGFLVTPAVPNGFFYVCTTAGKSVLAPVDFSGATHPGDTVDDGTVVWTWAGATPGVSTWSFAYQPVTIGALPYQLQSYRWTHYSGGSHTPDIDPYGSPFGWTELGNPRGDGLAFIATPLINSQRRWTFRQTLGSDGNPIVLQPGSNILYAAGNVGLDGGILQLAADPTSFWPLAQSRVSVQFEFPSVLALTEADLHVSGYTFIPKGGAQRNIAAAVINNGVSAITVVPVWHYENFVQNFDNNQP